MFDALNMKFVQKVSIMCLLLSTDKANLRLNNTALKVLFLGDYTFLPLAVLFLEALQEIIFWNVLQSSCCCAFTLSIPLKCHSFS